MEKYVCSKCGISKFISEFSKARDRVRGHRCSCKECDRERNRISHINNRDKNNKRKAAHYKENKDNILEYQAKYRSKRLKTDSLYKVRVNVGKLVQITFKRCGFKKSSKAKDILGCSYDEFKNYIESKFEDWMSWDNYGLCNGKLNYGWDLDHIIPIASAKTEEDIYKLNHFSNFQPLCSFTNRNIKKDKIIKTT